VTLNPGEEQTVLLKMAVSDLAYWDVRQKRFKVENEPVKIMAGPSSADIKQVGEIRIRN
jgi:beta-glucosidase